jgi:hypothetical protein
MIFINNKYTKAYFNIVENAKTKKYTGYTEKHHILPKSLGGTNGKNNLVRLSAREHFVCHKLLMRMVTGNARYKMIEAFSYFSNNTKRKLVFNSRQIEELSSANAIASSKRNKGNEFYKYRKPANENLKKLRAKNAANSRWVNNGIEEKFSPEHENLVKYSNFFYGRLPEIKNKMMGLRGPLKVSRVINKIECTYCNTMLDPGNFHRWHGEKCKNKGAYSAPL